MAALRALAHSIPSPGWFRASRCLHLAALIFDPLALAPGRPWAGPGPAGRPACWRLICGPLVAGAGLWLALASCGRLASACGRPAALPYLSALCGPLTGAKRSGIGDIVAGRHKGCWRLAVRRCGLCCRWGFPPASFLFHQPIALRPGAGGSGVG